MWDEVAATAHNDDEMHYLYMLVFYAFTFVHFTAFYSPSAEALINNNNNNNNNNLYNNTGLYASWSLPSGVLRS